MRVIEVGEGVAKLVERRRDELEQRLGLVGRYTRMRQCRTERWRMRRLRVAAIDGPAQALIFEADQALYQHFANVTVEQLGDTFFDDFVQVDGPDLGLPRDCA